MAPAFVTSEYIASHSSASY